MLIIICHVDLEWKIVYVGSAENEEYDQVLDTIMVGPVPVGVNKFLFKVRNRPSPTSLIPTLSTFSCCRVCVCV